MLLRVEKNFIWVELVVEVMLNDFFMISSGGLTSYFGAISIWSSFSFLAMIFARRLDLIVFYFIACFY